MKTTFLLILLLLLPPMAIANATPKNTLPFKYEAKLVVISPPTVHYCGPEHVIARLVQEFELYTYPGDDPVGTMTIDGAMIGNPEPALTTVTGQFVIEFASGIHIEGTIAGKLLTSTGWSDIKFVGHGDMHVQGALIATRDGQSLLLDGYSW